MIPQERQNYKNVFFLKTLLFLFKSVNIKNSTSKYAVQGTIWCNFFCIGSADFAEKGWMFVKFFINFSIYSKGGGGKFRKKTGDGTMFYIRLFVFPEIFMHFGRKKLGERKKYYHETML